MPKIVDVDLNQRSKHALPLHSLVIAPECNTPLVVKKEKQPIIARMPSLSTTNQANSTFYQS